MTSREALALAAVATPALAVLAVSVAPRRAVAGVATVGAIVAAAAALLLAGLALSSPGDPLVEPWLVVDAAAGLLVGVIGIVGLASVLVSPAYLTTTTSGLVPASRGPRLYFGLLFAFWSIMAAVPLIGNLGGAVAAHRGDDRRVRAPRRLQRQAARTRGGLEISDPHLLRASVSRSSGSSSSRPSRPTAASTHSRGATWAPFVTLTV